MIEHFSELVLLACHDLRTPVATARGFASTLLARAQLGEAEREWVGAVERSGAELSELLDLLGRASRIEAGKYEPTPIRVSLDESLQTVRERVGEERLVLSGADQGAAAGVTAEVTADRDDLVDALTALARCLLVHGGLERISAEIDGSTVRLGPVEGDVAAIALGDDLRDLRAAIAVMLLRASGAEPSVEGDRIVVVFAG